jgi:asparagine synthase (glutamine-hydrolysing)
MTRRAIWAGTAPLERCETGGCRVWARGYATGPDGTTYLGAAIGLHLAKHRDRLAGTASRLNGCFSAVLEEDDRTRVVADRFGTIPIYLGPDRSGSISVGDDPWRVIQRLAAPPKIDPPALVDLLHAGYVTGNRTLIEGIRTAGPAAITTLAGSNIRSERYWSYGYNPEPMETAEAIGMLADLLTEVIDRGNTILGRMGARPVLTLSGGLDSRLLAGLFARAKDGRRPTAVSYGMESDPEVAVAAEIAHALAIDFRTVPVDSSYLNRAFLERSVREVGLTTRFTCGTGARHLDCAAGDVLVPGHTGDFVSGGHLPPYSGLVGTRDQLHRFLDLRHFRYPLSDSILQKVLRVDCRSRFDGLAQTTADFDFGHDMFGLIDRWNVENRQRRLILMELRAYEQVAPWILPFYDYALIDFFARVPHRLRFGQRLFVQTVLERVFTDEAADLGTIRRVGKLLRIDHEANARITAFAQLPVALRTPLLGVWPIARDLRARLRNAKMVIEGPDPIQYWFRNDADVRGFLTDRIRSISLEGMDTDRLLALAELDDVPEEFFHRLITSAITAQEALDMAKSRWREGVTEY